MTIRRLYIFKTVCEEGSVTGAAKKLYMTQPAVSHVIHELEEELGTVLFDRISKKVFLNQTGKLLLKKTVRILELYEDLEKGVYDLENQAVLRVGASITHIKLLAARGYETISGYISRNAGQCSGMQGFGCPFHAPQ